MIFYGTRASNLKNGQIINIDCPNCQTNTSMTYSVFGKYAHVYWIPFFPISKITVAECNSCKKTFEYKELPEAIKTKFIREKEKSPVKTPIWMFSGLGIVVAIIGIVAFLNRKDDENTSLYAKNPKVGDVYYFELPEMKGHFSTLKITKISKDSIFVLSNSMEIDSKSDIGKIMEDKNYIYPESYSKVELKNLCKDLNVFYKITRD